MLFASEVLTQASGSIGGVTYSRNRSGLYRRARAVPVNPNSEFQVEVRSEFTNLVNRWTEVLTPAQRESWNLYGLNVPVTNPLGASITNSGQNWYIGANTIRGQILSKIGGTGFSAGPFVDAAPALFNRGEFTTPTFAIGEAGGVVVSFNDADEWRTEVDAFLLAFQGVPQNPSINFFNGPWRLIGALDGLTPVVSPITITAAQVAARGFPVQAGQAQWIAFAVTRADGRYSTRRIVGPNIVTAL